MVPPWVPDPPADAAAAAGTAEAEGGTDTSAATAATALVASSIAPAGRFGGARRSFGAYANSGSGTDMRRGLGHYVRSGYGGAPTASRRLAGTARNAAKLYNALLGAPSVTPSERVVLNVEELAGRSASEIMDRVVEAVAPIDGTLDAEASRYAIKEALSDVLVQFPDANLLDLSEEQRIFAIERYVALDVFRRFVLDVGKTIQNKAPNVKAALSRLKEVKDYIKQVVAAAFRRAREKGQALNSGQSRRVVQGALSDALQVFDHYAT